MTGIRFAAATEAMGEAFDRVNGLFAKLPKESEAWELKGDLLLRSGEYVEALKSYREAVTLNKDNVAAQIGIKALFAEAEGDPVRLDGLQRHQPRT